MTIKKNTTLKEIGEILAGANSVLLFPHDNPDPDAIGACMALCRMLRKFGAKAWTLIDRPLPGYLQFLHDPEDPLVTTNQEVIAEPEISFCVDCGEEKRFAGRAEAFRRGKASLCIDHHRVGECVCDHYYIDPEAAAASQIVYQLIGEMGWEITPEVARELYTGLDGDTGCFMHSNTTPEVHRIAADLMEYGVDINEINVNLYQSRDPKEVLVHVKALQTLDFLADGQAVMAKLTQADLKAVDANMEHAETVIDDLRSIDGVEIAAFLKEDVDRVRVSMRAKTSGNVAEIAQKFGGGGHIKAAGFKLDQPLDEVYEKLRAEIIRAVTDEAAGADAEAEATVAEAAGADAPSADA